MSFNELIGLLEESSSELELFSGAVAPAVLCNKLEELMIILGLKMPGPDRSQ